MTHTAARPCAVESRNAGEPLEGTAPAARAWLVIEQSGAYGRKALIDSGLPLTLGQRLEKDRKGSGTAVILGRRPGRHPHVDSASRIMWAANCAAGTMVIHGSARTEDAPDDLIALADGALPRWAPTSGPLLLVCTNGRRDTCCATLGRAALGPGTDPDVWECSHLGGHRFAATGVLLPWGYVYGRLDPEVVAEVMTGARRGQLTLTRLRGRSCWTAPGQVAEIAVRRSQGLTGLADIRDVHQVRLPDADPDLTVIRVLDRWHRQWEVTVTRSSGEWPGESCGGPPSVRDTWVAGPVRGPLRA